MNKIISGLSGNLNLKIIKNGVKSDPYSIPYVQIERVSDSKLIETFTGSQITKIDTGEFRVTLDTVSMADDFSITSELVGIGDGQTVKFRLENYPVDSYSVFLNGSLSSEYEINPFTGEIWLDNPLSDNYSISANYHVPPLNLTLSEGEYKDTWTVIFNESDKPEKIEQTFEIVKDDWEGFDFTDNIDITYTIRTKSIPRNSINRMLFNISVHPDDIDTDIIFKNGKIAIYDIRDNAFVEDADIEINGNNIYYNFNAKYSEGNYYAVITLSFADETLVSKKLWFKIV